MEYYRATFPSGTVLPKMHMLEDHVVPRVKQWKVGCGLMGEQGAESLHAAFNYTERAYSNMRERADRLKEVLQNHHLRILPVIEAAQPGLIKRRRKQHSTE